MFLREVDQCTPGLESAQTIRACVDQIPVDRPPSEGSGARRKGFLREVNRAAVEVELPPAWILARHRAEHRESQVFGTTGADRQLHQIIEDEVAGADLVGSAELLGEAAAGRVPDRDLPRGKTGRHQVPLGFDQTSESGAMDGAHLIGAGGMIGVAGVAQQAGQLEIRVGPGRLGQCGQAFRIIPGDAGATGAHIHLDPEPDEARPARRKPSQGGRIVEQEPKLDVSPKIDERRDLVRVDRHGHRDVPPVEVGRAGSVACVGGICGVRAIGAGDRVGSLGEIAGHLDRGDGDRLHPPLAEPFADGGGLVGLEVRPQTHAEALCPADHAVEIGPGTVFVEHERGPPDAGGERGLRG